MIMNIRDGPRMHLRVVRLTSGTALSTSARYQRYVTMTFLPAWSLSRSVVGMT
jgi:hypothetical protein